MGFNQAYELGQIRSVLVCLCLTMIFIFLALHLFLKKTCDEPLLTSQQALNDAGMHNKEISLLLRRYFQARQLEDNLAVAKIRELISNKIRFIEKTCNISNFLKRNDQWNRIIELAIETPKAFLKNRGCGFFKTTFKDVQKIHGRDHVFNYLNYISIPKDYNLGERDPFPVILFLHPKLKPEKIDEQVLDMAESIFADQDIRNDYIILAPVGLMRKEGENQVIVDTANDWEDVELGLCAAFSAIRILLEQMVFDKSRLALFGVKEGGDAAFKYAEWYPSSFAGVVGRDASVEECGIENTSQIPFLHMSTRDNAAPSMGALKSMAHGTFLEDSGSLLKPSQKALTGLKGWLRKLQKELTPRTIFLKTDSIAYGSNSWLSIIELEDTNQGNTPWIRGVADRSANGIHLESNGVARVRIFFNDKLLDLDKEVTIIWNNKKRFQGHIRRSLDKMLDHLYNNLSGSFEIFSNSLGVEL